jgi:hypothetical protein|tara:strand:+ start:607 stop:1209 length:603 start_codon:yes stop_codon:yes gene_type:complete
MQVKIKKEGKTKNYNIVDSWEDVTLEKFMQLNMEEDVSKTKEVEQTIALLSDLPQKLIKELSLRDVINIFEKLAELQVQENEMLTTTLTIDGVEYGMHPDLSEITLGEYADIETYVKMGLQKHLPEIMAILFRPIVEKEGDVYTIEAYNGDIKIRAEKMKQMNAEQVQKVLVFFWTFVRLLLVILPLSLIKSNQKNNKKE